MHNPAYPGKLLTGWLDDLGVSVTAFVEHIGISRVMLSRVLHCHAAVSADIDFFQRSSFRDRYETILTR
ncbi:MAG: hypothetical protein PHQ58_11930 [Rhodoferax sp.]|uniref:hypothetical protein n=1 Tax=Rhodoferax sp. TaxID=50421 RepID=UPI002625E1FF|nr:hypothetical protein [Rhodoferax sp.]MDD2881136.1 hypothetical protein [Rhodoferax sp.]